jgi:hypothetical protein
VVLQSGELRAGNRLNFQHAGVVISKGVVVLQLRQVVLDDLLLHVARLDLLVLSEQTCANVLIFEVVISF